MKKKDVAKNVLGGTAVGIANIIPGVSGGTMLVVLGIFDQLMESISDVFKVKTDTRKASILFILQVLIGAGIGLVVFAKIVDWLFLNYPTQTFYWFIGLVAFSIPMLIKKEMKGHKVSWPWLVLGIILIATIAYFTPVKEELTLTEFPELKLTFLMGLIFVGMISGATMLFPGVSGSMILLIIGQYYLFKSYVANVTSFQLDVLIPLCFLGVGIVIGILISAKLTSFLLKHVRRQTVSFILGLIIASVVVLIPLDVTYNLGLIISSLIALIIGGVSVVLIERMA